MNKILKWVVIGIGAMLIASISILIHNNRELKKDLSTAAANIKAYSDENSSLKNDARVFQLTVEQLSYYNDSILQKMNGVRKELEIKDKNLKAMQYMLSEASKTDTIEFRDTIFREPTLHIDTLLGDKWYQIWLELKYPSTIVTTSKFISEKYVIVDYKKETINPPKKCWLLRLFQKKHKVVEVNVVEKNPYIENKQQRFIEIVE